MTDRTYTMTTTYEDGREDAQAMLKIGGFAHARDWLNHNLPPGEQIVLSPDQRAYWNGFVDALLLVA